MLAFGLLSRGGTRERPRGGSPCCPAPFPWQLQVNLCSSLPPTPDCLEPRALGLHIVFAPLHCAERGTGHRPRSSSKSGAKLGTHVSLCLLHLPPAQVCGLGWAPTQRGARTEGRHGVQSRCPLLWLKVYQFRFTHRGCAPCTKNAVSMAQPLSVPRQSGRGRGAAPSLGDWRPPSSCSPRGTSAPASPLWCPTPLTLPSFILHTAEVRPKLAAGCLGEGTPSVGPASLRK